MAKRIFTPFIIALLCLFTLACTNQNAEYLQKDKDEAANVIKQFEATQAQITYKDPASFTAGDKYLTPEFAQKYHGEIRADMERFIKDSKATVSGKEPTVTFKERDGDNLIFDFKADRMITIEGTNQAAASHVEYVVTVTKQEDGSFLISNMVESGQK